ncbi:MAG: SdrD B-like domain-containing protein [Anaerolineales bacterium]
MNIPRLNKKHLPYLTFAALSALLAGCVGAGNFVWLDANGNGIQDAGEPGLGEVEVTLYRASDDGVVTSTVTDGSGVYGLSVQAGSQDFYLGFEAPGGLMFTLQDQGGDDALDSDVDPATGLTATYTLGTVDHIDAGLISIPDPETEAPSVVVEQAPTVAAIGGFAWIDGNANGLQDEDEPPLPDVAINLVDANGNLVADTATSPEGLYLFEEVAAGQEYHLIFTPSTEYLGSLMDAGDDAADSDADPETGETDPFELAESGQDLDAGFYTQAAAAACYGPLASEFPEGYSPLSGLPVDDPTLLTYRPVFLSISIFPPSVRPPTGLSVSPIIYQLYIGEGDTRLMAGFYGQFPQPDYDPGTGEGAAAPADFQYLIGDRVWFDSNGNHLQDLGEPGVPDVPVRLVDINLNTVETTTTDAQGNYYFALNDVEINTEFQIRFGAPPSIGDYYWVNKDLGDDAIDSDVTGLGYTDFFDPTDEDINEQLNFDAGVRKAYRIEGLRSGRVAYQDLQVNYCGCLITAGADPTVAQLINTCGSAFGEDPNNIGGAGLDVTRLQTIAANNTQGACAEPNLSGNLFCGELPSEFGEGGEGGQELFVEYNVNNISHFVYDAQLGAYLWELVEPGTQNFDVMTDRLTGETLTFENVVVLVVPHTAQNSDVTIINLEMTSARGKAYLFRNGQVFELEWSTQFPDYITDRDQPIPVHFELNGEPFPLAPGQTFINLVNVTGGVMSLTAEGIWRADFDAPAFSE